jgi:hypothetical protein
MTWEQFSRAVKFVVAMVWGTMELWMWGGRPYPLAFILAVIIGSEAYVVWKHLPQMFDQRDTP